MEKLYYLFKETGKVTIDTRQISPGCLFIGIKGQNFDGNSFAAEALKLGAKYAVVDNSKYQTNPNIILVDDCLDFIQKLAHYHRKQFQIPVIGITGSNGKTTNKELIHAVLASHFEVHCTKGNLNNHLGVPLTLLGLKEGHQIAIIEMGANKPGDIAELCAIATPDIALITNIGKAHLEGFINFEGIFNTKTELFRSLPNDATIIYNADDEIISHAIPKHIKSFGFSQKDKQFLFGQLCELTPFVHFEYEYEGYQSGNIATHLVGKYNVNNFLAAVAFGLYFKVPVEKINESISNYIPSNNRSQITKTDHNTLIVDCYNANPSSMQLALENLKEINHPNKMAIIGDMLELGTDSKVEHEKIIAYLKQHAIDFITVGYEFSKVNQYQHFETTSSLEVYLNEHPFKDALILLKGSRGIGLERLIPKL